MPIRSNGNKIKPSRSWTRSRIIAATIAMNTMVMGSRSQTKRALFGAK